MAKTFEIANRKEMAVLCAEILKVLDKGRGVRCEVKSTASKTMSQLGYYWDVILPRVQAKFREDGDNVSLSFINKFFNDMFFYDEYVIFGRAIKETRSKSGATIEEMSAFLEKVLQWCAEQGIYIPEPQQV